MIAHVVVGNTHRLTAERFVVSVKSVNDMVKLQPETGSLAPKPQDNPGWSKVGAYDAWVRARLAETGDLTLAELAAG